MNTRQLRVAVVGLIMILLACAFPPWSEERVLQSYVVSTFIGFRFYFSPPDGMPAPRIDLSLLVIEWVVVLAITCLAMIIAATPSNQQGR